MAKLGVALLVVASSLAAVWSLGHRGGPDVPDSVRSAGASQLSGLWNVQAFLPSATTYQRPSYKVLAADCGAPPKPARCVPDSAGTAPLTTTTPAAMQVTNPAPVASLGSIHCSQPDARSPAWCLALGTSPAKTPVVVTTEDGGAHWRIDGPPLSMTTMTALSCPGPGVCFVAGSAGGFPTIGLTTDNGGHWKSEPITNDASFHNVGLATISCPSASFCVAAGQLATNYQTKGFLAQTPLLLVMSGGRDFRLPSYRRIGLLCCQGSNWGGFAEPGLPSSVQAVACPNPSLCLLTMSTAANDINFGRSTDGGLHWSAAGGQYTFPPGSHGAFTPGSAFIRCSDAVHCWQGFVVDYGLGGPTPFDLFATSDGGAHWRYQPLPASEPSPSTVSCVSNESCVSVGQGISESADGGSNWVADLPPTSLSAKGINGLNDVSCTGPKRCWAVGQGASGAFILDTMGVPGFSGAARILPVCPQGRLPEIGAPCRVASSLTGLFAAPSCLSRAGSAPATGTSVTGATTGPTSGGSTGRQRLEGESISYGSGTPVSGVFATMSLASMCRTAQEAPATSSLVIQNFSGSSYIRAGIRYDPGSAGDPNGADHLFVEFATAGTSSAPGQFGLAGTGSGATARGTGSVAGEQPFTDVTWLTPLSSSPVQVGMVSRPAPGGGLAYDLYYAGPTSVTTPGTPTATSAFPFTGPPLFAFTCPPSQVTAQGSCGTRSGASPSNSSYDTVDLVNQVSGPGIEMPGSCNDPLTYSGITVDRGRWQPLPQIASVGGNGAALAFDPGLAAWVQQGPSLQSLGASVDHVALWAEDGIGASGTGPGPGATAAGAELSSSAVDASIASGWQVQNTSPSAQDTAVTMSDLPCGTWAGLP